MTRQEIKDKIASSEEAINSLYEIIGSLRIKDALLCDDQQWYTEQKEVILTYEGRKKIESVHLIGRIHWKEDFKDMSTGKIITLERNRMVRADGRWMNLNVTVRA